MSSIPAVLDALLTNQINMFHWGNGGANNIRMYIEIGGAINGPECLPVMEQTMAVIRQYDSRKILTKLARGHRL